jgi:hypothetical protein
MDDEDEATELAPIPSLVSGGIVPHLLAQSRKFRGIYFRTMEKLDQQSLQETGRSRMEIWADENYGDAIKLAPKLMMKEPEAAPQTTVEDFIKEIDQRSKKAKLIDGSAVTPSSSPRSPSSSD